MKFEPVDVQVFDSNDNCLSSMDWKVLFHKKSEFNPDLSMKAPL